MSIIVHQLGDLVIMVNAREYVRVCPLCGNDEFVKDRRRAETYCNKCGLVLSSAYQYVGLEKVDNIIPYSAPYDAKGVHIGKTKVGRFNNRKTTNYRHNIPNWQLMKRGRSHRKTGHHI